MAKKWKKEEEKAFDYGEERRKLHAEGPRRVYILRGEEDYLRDSYLGELRALCVEEGTEAFNYHRLTGLSDMTELQEALEAMPFMGERTFTEVRQFDVNKTSSYDAELFKSLLTDVPEWATVAFVFPPDYAPDNRLNVVKAMKKAGVDLEFKAPREAALVKWIQKQAAGHGKRIDGETANYLIWVSGVRMNALIPEITKICGAAAGEEVTRGDIDAVAKRAPETTIFDLTDALGAREYGKAAALLADLLDDQEEPAQKQIYMVSEQFRRLYAAKIAEEYRRPDDYIVDCVPEVGGRPYLVTRLRRTSRSFSQARLARAVRLCAECDLGMKSSGGPAPEEQMKELLLKLAMDRT